MKKIIIVTNSFLNSETGSLGLGGVETYMYNLSLACQESSYDVIVCQLVSFSVSKEYNIHGILCKCIPSSNNQKSFDRIYKMYNDHDTVFIIGTDQMDIKNPNTNVITIQHGIAFDIPGNMIEGFLGRNRMLQSVNKLLRCIKNVQRMNFCQNTVCVDYNYYNWYKTLGTIHERKKVWVIPNYASDFISNFEFEQKLLNSAPVKKIVFARRFVEYRGSIIFAKVIKRLFDENFKFEVTLAGDGPCKKQMMDILKGYSNVRFTSYEATESIRFHYNYDIAVVPTIYSEGTSLALCESMAAGCFPVSTYVGGLSNILVDHYNGLLCTPNEDSLYESLKEALTMDRHSFDSIVRAAYQTATTSFSLSLWKTKWMKVISEVFKEQ